MPAPRTSKSIVWLASYPKSGNTWTRIFIGNYLLGGDAPMPINRISQIGTADSAASLYRATGGTAFNPTDPNQALQLRTRVLQRITANGADVNFVKTHNFRGRVMGIELIPAALTRSAIGIIRDPRDVAVSYARHFGFSPGEAIATMARAENSTAPSAKMVKQYLGNWSAHVRSWAEARDFPVLMLRYEDMMADPAAAFTKVLSHIGMPVEADRLARAIRFSDFDEMQRQEANATFVERSGKSEKFFHTGTSGQWRDGGLTDDLVARIERDHGPTMRKWGYLDE